MSERLLFGVLLSHNSADKPWVRRWAEQPRATGLRVWSDEWVVQPGDDHGLGIEESYV